MSSINENSKCNSLSEIKQLISTINTDKLAKIWLVETKNWVGHTQLSEYYKTPYPNKINPILGPDNEGEFVSFPTESEYRNYLLETRSLKGIINLMRQTEILTYINSEGWLKYQENLKTWWSQDTKPDLKVKTFSEKFS